MAANRIFDEVSVGNFHAQKGRQRLLEYDHQDRPRIAPWRSNLTALSDDFNLYFAAYGDKIHVTRPRDLYQTLPGTPDLVLDLPRSPQGISAGGFIDHIHPHDVNSIKVGMLGDFEILLIACDDGDLMAYYTRLLERVVNVSVTGSSRRTASINPIPPFFHENVDISAWGLAIHQVSRLIAVGTNNHEVIVFQPGLACGYDAVTGSRYYQERTGSAWPGRSFPAASSPFAPVWKLDFRSDALGEFESKDCRLKLLMGPSGSNVPSIDFVSDENGEASVVLATDVNGRLWSLDLTQREETLVWPEIHQDPCPTPDSDDEFEPRGWGVLCIPTSYFMLVQSPQEALGLEELQSALQLNTESSVHCLQSLNITSSVAAVGHSALIHPSPSSPTLELENDPIVPPARSGPCWTDVVRPYVLGLLNDYEHTSYMVQQPTKIPGFQSEHWVKRMISLLSSEDWYSEAVGEWIYKIYHRVKLLWKGGEAFHDAMKALQFLLQLPLVTRYRINKWDGLQQAMTGIEDFEEGLEGELKKTKLSKTQLTSIAKKKQAIPRLQEGQMAVIRTSAYDIELIPPNPDMLSTTCRNFLQQKLPNDRAQEFLAQFDRLNMFAVIPELSLLVVASQKGRVGLFTLTRLDDDFADVGPVLMMRLDRILPLTVHEKEFRPNIPIMGMAVGPLQGKDRDGGVQRRIWRLILHYMDHTVLSYELKRDGGLDGLEVF